MRSRYIVPFLALAALACDSLLGPEVPRPENLYYELEPSGDPDEPLGVILRWDEVLDDDLQIYRVYSSPDGVVFGLRGETTSSSFHDKGIPDMEYYVVAVDLDGDESEPSESVVIDERLRLEAPAWLESTSLNGAIYLVWSDNAFDNAWDEFGNNYFMWYRVYSTPYSLDTQLCDGDGWGLEGTTVAPEFLVGILDNGVPRCFGISSISVEGYESLWSPLRADTPRPDARNVIVWATDANLAAAGFRFWQDVNLDGTAQLAELGIVTSGASPDVDFRVSRNAGGALQIDPVRLATQVRLYAAVPIDDLTSIDIAPVAGYDVLPIVAQPRYGYVFEMIEQDLSLRYGALRVTHAGADYIIFDWSFQTDYGNPELSIGAGIHTAGGTGVRVYR